MKYIPKTRIEPIIKEAQRYFKDYPPDLVEAAILHQFREIRNFLEAPTHPTLLVRSLGRFIPSRKSMEHAIQSMIRKMRSGRIRNDLRNRSTIMELWRRRRLAQAFEAQFKYLKRFKQWHYKHKNPPSLS